MLRFLKARTGRMALLEGASADWLKSMVSSFGHLNRCAASRTVAQSQSHRHGLAQGGFCRLAEAIGQQVAHLGHLALSLAEGYTYTHSNTRECASECASEGCE
eukprot:9438272-Pyramimonas_sp.AAC.1